MDWVPINDPAAEDQPQRQGEAVKLRGKGRSDASRAGGYVGDHADKLSRVRPIVHDEDERPRREDLDYGRTVFDGSWWRETLPHLLRGRGKRGP